MDTDTSGCGPLIVWGIILAAVASYGWPSETVSAYERVCAGSQTTMQECLNVTSNSRWYSATEYRADVDRQFVVEGGPLLQRHENCVVLNKTNWQCRGADGLFSVVMDDGKLTRAIVPGIVREPASWLEYKFGIPIKR